MLRGVDALTAAASGATDLPLADRGTSWDSSAAESAVLRWAGGPGENTDWMRFGRAFFWHPPNPSKTDDFKLPFATIVNGRLTAVPAGVFAAANAAANPSTYRGTGVGIPDSDIGAVRGRIAAYYRRMDATPPWAREGDRVRASVAVEGVIASVTANGKATIATEQGDYIVDVADVSLVEPEDLPVTLTASALTAAISSGVQQGVIAAIHALKHLDELEERMLKAGSNAR